jgi:hypothetical protein
MFAEEQKKGPLKAGRAWIFFVRLPPTRNHEVIPSLSAGSLGIFFVKLPQRGITQVIPDLVMKKSYNPVLPGILFALRYNSCFLHEIELKALLSEKFRCF